MTLTDYMTAMRAWNKLKSSVGNRPMEDIEAGEYFAHNFLNNDGKSAMQSLDDFFSQFEKEFEASFKE